MKPFNHNKFVCKNQTAFARVILGQLIVHTHSQGDFNHERGFENKRRSTLFRGKLSFFPYVKLVKSVAVDYGRRFPTK